MKLISVCLATFNGEKYLKKQLDSILCQMPSSGFEIIISDDGSTDSTISIIDEYMINNSSISLYRNSFNSVVKNFEFLLTIATGKYIYFSDQDDIWVTDKLEITQKAFESGFELVLSDCKIIDETDNIIGDSFFERNHSGKGFLKNLYKNSYIGCCLAISSSVKSKVLPFGKNIPMHDYWIGLYLEFFHPDKICFLKEQLVLYRKHIGNISNTAIGVSQNSLFKKLKIRLYLIYYILKFS